MNSTSVGKQAEAAVAHRFREQGYQILTQNWRTRFCEIDIVARRKDQVVFIEVKYRTSNSQGGGLDYITPKKLAQMRFAAQFWCSENDWRGDYQLIAAAVSFNGKDYLLDNVVEVS